MDVATITMPADEARAKLEEYRQGLDATQTRNAREPTDEDRGVILGLQAIAKGKSLINLHAVFRACPADPQGRPRLAVGRSHWRRCVARIDRDGSALFDQDWPGQYFGASRVAWHRRVSLPRETLPEALRPNGAPFHGNRRMKAVVPLIPPNLRPARGLNRYLTLWEAEWESVPADPLLLRHLHGSLYVVLAAWDLTSLERAVLSGRLSERT